MGPRDIPRLAETTFDWRVLLFAAAITLLTGLLSGFAPIWTAGKLDLVGALKESSRSATGGKSGHAVRGALVVAEIAITLALTFAAGLLLRSLIAAQTVNPGFAPEHLLALELVLPSARYPSAPAVQAFYDRLRQDLRGLPGVTAVGAVNCPPSAGDCGDWFYSILDGPAPQPGEVPIAAVQHRGSRLFFGHEDSAAGGPRDSRTPTGEARREWRSSTKLSRANGGRKYRPWDTASSRAGRTGMVPYTKSWA